MGTHLEVSHGEEQLRQQGQLEEEDVAGAEELRWVPGAEPCGAGRGAAASAARGGERRLGAGLRVGVPNSVAIGEGTQGHGHGRWHPMVWPQEVAPKGMAMGEGTQGHRHDMAPKGMATGDGTQRHGNGRWHSRAWPWVVAPKGMAMGGGTQWCGHRRWHPTACQWEVAPKGMAMGDGTQRHSSARWHTMTWPWEVALSGVATGDGTQWHSSHGTAIWWHPRAHHGHQRCHPLSRASCHPLLVKTAR